MIQSIYAEVSNGNQVSCGKRHPKYKSVPIPLMKTNYLGEFRTLLEKAKARANLGIGDEYTLSWGNITGHIEDNETLTTFIENQWKYSYVSPYIALEITNVKQALDYALYYVSTYESNEQMVISLGLQFDELKTLVQDTDENLQQQITNNDADIETIQLSIDTINQAISDINIAIETIDVDKNIENWVNNNLQQSQTIYFKEIFLPKTDGEGNIIYPLKTDEEGTPLVDENDNPIYEEEPEMEVAFHIMEVKISELDGNILEAKEDGLYVKSYDQDINDINQNIINIQDKQETVDLQLVDLKYVTTLPDSTTSPVHEGVTVEQLKNKSLTEILDTVLFPAETPELQYPYIYYSDIPTLVEVNSAVLIPEMTYIPGDAGETIDKTSVLTYQGNPYTNDYYNSVGTYTFTATASYGDGNYLVNNRGEETTLRIEAGQVQDVVTVKVTYPWYAGSTEDGTTKQVLVPVGQLSGILDFSLTKHAVIKIPGKNSTIQSFRLDSGLGYLDVDMDGWTSSQEYVGDVLYKVWTKQDSYSAILPHRINFIINV